MSPVVIGTVPVPPGAMVAEPTCTVTLFCAPAVTAMLMPAVAVCAGLELSATWTVKLLVPATVGVPLMTPVDAARLRPAGRRPLRTDQM